MFPTCLATDLHSVGINRLVVLPVRLSTLSSRGFLVVDPQIWNASLSEIISWRFPGHELTPTSVPSGSFYCFGHFKIFFDSLIDSLIDYHASDMSPSARWLHALSGGYVYQERSAICTQRCIQSLASLWWKLKCTLLRRRFLMTYSFLLTLYSVECPCVSHSYYGDSISLIIIIIIIIYRHLCLPTYFILVLWIGKTSVLWSSVLKLLQPEHLILPLCKLS